MDVPKLLNIIVDIIQVYYYYVWVCGRMATILYVPLPFPWLLLLGQHWRFIAFSLKVSTIFYWWFNAFSWRFHFDFTEGSLHFHWRFQLGSTEGSMHWFKFKIFGNFRSLGHQPFLVLLYLFFAKSTLYLRQIQCWIDCQFTLKVISIKPHSWVLNQFL